MKYASATVRLNIETYAAGMNQPTHPSVIAFEEPWNGYKYWMAYSPFPNSNQGEENPSIAVSNDLFCWETPQGFVNPIAFNEETGCRELKDPHILYRDDLDRIEVWYLGRLHPALGGDGKTLTLFRKYSSDGVHWSDYEILTETQYLCPSVIREDGRYKLWEIGFGKTDGLFCYRESEDGVRWSNARLCSIDRVADHLMIWHGSVCRFNGTYYLSYIETETDSKKILLAESEDGITFTTLQKEITLSEQWESFYRPFLLWCAVGVFCFYGVIDRENCWYISLSYGKDLSSDLQGIGKEHLSRMKPLVDEVTDTMSLKYKIRRIVREITRLSRPETCVLVIPAALLFLCGHLIASCAAAVLIAAGIFGYLSRFKTKRHPGTVSYILTCIWQTILTGFAAYGIASLLRGIF